MSEEGIDLSGAMDMLKNMLSDEEGQQQIQNILSMFQGGEKEAKTPGQVTGGIDPENLEMVMKVQRAMELMNHQKENHQTKLLAALRPFLKPERKEKIDRAMKLLKFTGLFEIMKEVQGE